MKHKEEVVLLISGILFLLFFSYATTPLLPWSYGWDSSFFQIVGSGMTKGYIPYRDFFDMKGPWLFFIEYFGQLIIYGRTGCFVVQVISISITLYLCSCIYKRYYDGRGIIKSLLTILPFFLVMAVTMEGGNLTEELSLPFLFLSLYFAMKYIKEREDNIPKYSVIYGLCFGILALIRITNSVLICAIMFTISLSLIAEKKWWSLFRNIIAFFMGIVLAFIPPLLYYGYYGQIKEMLFSTFVFGFIYGTEEFKIGKEMFLLLPILLPLIAFVVRKNSNIRMLIFILCNIAGTAFVLGMGSPNLHDYLLIIPGMMLGVWELSGIKEWSNIWKNRRDMKRSVRVIALTGLLLLLFMYPFGKMISVGKYIISLVENKQVYDDVMEIAKIIPPEERDSVLGYEVSMSWYAISDIMPSNRYCGWQEHYMELYPPIEEEMKEAFDKNPPQWLVVKSGKNLKNEMIISQLKDKYGIVEENENIRLYCRSKGEKKQ